MHPQSPVAASWFAVTVRPNHERSAEQSLLNRGLEAYLPTQKIKRQWSDRVKEMQSVIFPGYVFCRFEMAERVRVLGAAGVRSIVSSNGKPLAVEDHEIASVRTLLASGKPVLPWPYLNVGQTVVIREGPFAWCRGVVIRVKDSLRVVVSVDALACSIAVEVDAGAVDVERVVQ